MCISSFCFDFKIEHSIETVSIISTEEMKETERTKRKNGSNRTNFGAVFASATVGAMLFTCDGVCQMSFFFVNILC